jgi:glutathione synthase/RimK-type ligase-like ATP-grasp enzyme
VSVVVLTPDAADASFQGRWREVHARLEAALASVGVGATALAWTEAERGDLAEAALVLPLLAWGYHRDHDRWLASVDRWEAAGVRLANPAAVLRWNSDKRYLVRLGALGAPVVPTVFTDDLTLDALHEAATRFGAGRLVAKPLVSASAYRTVRWSPGDALDGAPEGPAMIQPYLAAVEDEGEASLIYIDGVFSHALRKVAQAGDFRVQPDWGGSVHPWTPDAAALEAAGRVLAAVEESLLYARIDLVRGEAGGWLLIEAELIEPDLYFDADPRRGALLAEVVARRIGG